MGTRGKTPRWHKEKPHISKSFCQWIVKPAVPLSFRFGCFGDGGGENAKAHAPGWTLTLRFLADTSTPTQKVWGVFRKQSTCVKAKEAGGTSTAKLHIHSGLLSESQEQFLHQWKYSQGERETRPLRWPHSSMNKNYLCFLVYDMVPVLYSHFGVDITLILQGRHLNLWEYKSSSS